MRFLINTFTHWDEPPRARHQVAHALSKTHQVTFVAANKPGFPGIRTFTVHENLEVIIPRFPISNKIRWRLRLINGFYQKWLFKKLVKKYKDFNVINFDFTAVRINDFFDHVIFYYNDNFAGISARTNPTFIAKYHQSCESETASKARFCVAVSDMLRDKLLEFNESVYTILLGSPDMDEYNVPIPREIQKGSRIKAGLVGYITTKNTSIKILNLLLQDPDIDLTLIGPVDEKVLDQLDNRERLNLTGPLVGKELYEEINRCDVAISPYCARLVNAPNRGQTTGNKLYQYLAVGKPVVMTNLQGLSELTLPDGFIYVVHREDDFVETVKMAFEVNSTELRDRRIRYGKENSWSERMRTLIELYDQRK